MKVFALQRQSHVAQGVASLSVSARVTEVLEYLQENEQNFTFISLAEDDPLCLSALNWADVLILSKHSSTEAITIAKTAKRLGVKVVYDIDDWIFSFPSYSGGGAQNDKLGNISELIDLSDIVTVANTILFERLKSKYKKLYLVPNGMWVEKYTKSAVKPNSREDRRPKIVFTNADLIKMESAKDSLFTALQVFFSQNKHYVLDFYGDPFPEIPSLPFLHYTNRMPYDSYMRALIRGRYSFSISPLGAEEDQSSLEFNECKNPFKYLNYGAARVPGIYSSSTIYKNCIENKVNGLLVDNDYKSWLDALNTLANNHELRDIIRKNAHEDVMNNYHIRFSARELLNILKNENEY